MTHKLAISLVATFIALAGCGGGSGPDAVAAPVTPESLSLLSYENRHVSYEYEPNNWLPVTGSNEARLYFKYPDGSDGFISQQLVSYPGNSTLATAQPGIIHFLKKVNGSWESNLSQLEQPIPTCIHARKVIAADFNKDGVKDFVIACHGWDGSPFPGERSRVILSQPTGKYRLAYFSNDVDFQHGGTSIDINNDGAPDVVMTGFAGVGVYLNDGTGFFNKSDTINYRSFHTEALDLTKDGKPDLVLGGHEWEVSTRIIVNRGDNNFVGTLFNRPDEIVIPSVPAAGVIADFLYVKSVNSLYILRTGGTSDRDPNFYKGVWLQKFNLDTRLSTVVYANPDFQDTSGRRWLSWILEKDGYIVSDYGTSLNVHIE